MTAPAAYLFYGDDELARTEALDQMRHKLGDAAISDLNSIRLSAPSLDLAELSLACQTVPFLSSRRIVAITEASELTRHSGWVERLNEIVFQAPATTALVLLEDFDFAEVRRKERHRSSTAPEDLHRARSPLGPWAAALGDRILRKAFEKPRGAAFLGWIHNRASSLGGSIEAEAASALAEMVEGDPRLADRELSKLLDYVNRDRPVVRSDVNRLTPFHTQADVFAMVDALGARDTRRALAHLHAVLQDEDPQYAMHMIARQVRLLLQTREALELRRELSGPASRLPPFLQAKLRSQASNFSLSELETLHRRLVDLDLAAKSSQTDLAAGLDTFIAESAGA